MGGEGNVTLRFMQKYLLDYIDIEGKRVLEIGPKHGLHTKWISKQKPEEITIVELYNKKGLSWLKKIKSPIIEKRGWFQEIELDGPYDLVLFAGVIYHNLDQMGMLMKIHKLLKKDGIMVFESSTCRNDDFREECVIEVHHPERFRDVSTIKFHPTKAAMKAMAEIAGFEILEEDESLEDRENLLCQKVNEIDYGYKDKHKVL